MKRGSWNLVVDLASLVAFVLVVSTGMVLDMVLPPGSGRLPIEGGSRPEVLLLWGLSRHQWGQLHWWCSFGLLLLLTVHVGLHWRFFRSAFRRGGDSAIRRRLALGVCGLLALLALAVAPFLSPVSTHSVEQEPITGVSVGAQLYERECQRCHALGSKALIPEGSEGERFLRHAEPAKAHLRLREMSDDEVRDLLRYVRGQTAKP